VKNNLKILLSAYDAKERLISHFGIIEVGLKSGQHLRNEMKFEFDKFTKYNGFKPSYMSCRFIFIDPDKEDIEYRKCQRWPGYEIISNKFQTTLFYYKPDIGVQYKTI